MPNNEGIPPGVEQQPLPPERVPPLVSVPVQPSDQVTPHRITTIIFIIDYLHGKQNTLLSPPERSKICSTVLKMIQFPDKNLLSTCEALVNGLGRRQLVTWAKRIVEVHDKGIAGLMDLFQAADKLIDESPDKVVLRKRSIVGLLLRRMYLQFDKMSFSEISSLQVRFTSYFSVGANFLNSLIQDCKDESDLDFSLEEYKFCKGILSTNRPAEEDEKLMTRRQADLFIARQANLLMHSEGHALPPIHLQKELNLILRSNPGLSEAYFLSYLNSLRLNEFVGAVDSLYVASYHLITSGANNRLTVADVNKNFRYGNLNLVSLHARLGHKGEALAAVREAIAIGREAKDHTCLQHALSWLSRVSDENGLKQLKRSIAKCEELSIPYLASLGLLTFCSYTEEYGLNPDYMMDSLTKSAVLNCKHNLTELQLQSFLVRAKVWDSWGRPLMAQTVNQLLLQLNMSDARCSSVERSKDGISYKGEAILLALLNTALSLEQEGHRSEADTVLRLCEKVYPCPVSQYSQIWKLTKQRILFSRFLMSGNWVKAETSLSLIVALPSPAATSSHQPAGGMSYNELYRAELLFRKGDFEKARDIVKTIIGAYDQVGLKRNSAGGGERKEALVRALILLSDILVIWNDPGGAVEHLLHAKNLTVTHRLELLHCLICLHIANIQLILGAPQRALKLVQHALTFLLAHGNKRDRSRGLLLCAKCRVAASAEMPEVERRADLLEGALQVGTAKDWFIQLHDWDRSKDCLYLQARIYHCLGLTEERNMAAQQYKKQDELYPTVSPVQHLILI